ncbi:hypothetical protein Zm00014a_015102 [Zea mays]|uniref:J domain-containing protein n=1 Tax=Zea mays TaxID=4577 RepID=A0A3L6EER9_MAIZE|nr:hypothetical protein Zm00014a_015102 [Zea mays]
MYALWHQSVSGIISNLTVVLGSLDSASPSVKSEGMRRAPLRTFCSMAAHVSTRRCSLQESSNKQMRKQKGGTGSKAQRSAPGKNPCGKNKRFVVVVYLDDKNCTLMFNLGGHYWKSFDDDDECAHTPYGTYGGKKSFTWYWPGEDDGLGSNPSGFQWREESQSAKSKEKFWNESDVDEDEGSSRDDLRSYRISLGLPVLGPLKLDHIKAAFRASALKWHPDKHQGPSQAEAEEKFRRCVEAYNALTRAFRSSG